MAASTWDRTAPDSTTLKANQRGVVLEQPSIPGFSFGGGGTSDSANFSGIDNPEALAILLKTLGELSKGGSPEIKRQQAERNKQVISARASLGEYTKGSAFTDAANLMAQQLRLAMEKNMPAINKAIQGAGTSASSMQGLLSQKLALESSQATSALGAEQAKAYGSISAQLQGVLEALTRVDRGGEENLIKALTASATSRGSTTQVQNPTQSQTASTGGQVFQSFEDLATTDGGGSAGSGGIESGVWYGPNKKNANGSYVPLGSDESYYNSSGQFVGY